MTTDRLRAEAEKVAAEVRIACSTVDLADPRAQADAYERIIADAILAFAQKHAAEERLRGQIEELDDLISFYRKHTGILWDTVLYGKETRVAELRKQLAALEKGEEVAG